MKSIKYISFLIILVIVGFFVRRIRNTDNIGYPSFTTAEMRFVQPFQKDTVIVYKSILGQTDTIKFFKASIDTTRVRNNLELGNFNINVLFVGYKITTNSFHKITTPNIHGVTVHYVDTVPSNFVRFKKTLDSSDNNREIDFLGLLFGSEYLDKILNTKADSIVFNSKNAEYQLSEYNKGIKSFIFDFKRGIVSFIDDEGVEWHRSN